MEYRIDIPKNVNLIIKLLEDAGYEAFSVGGCVRDALMGREPMDWDITTSAAPSDIKSIFRRTIDTGIQHGTVTVMMDKIGYEVTTYRIDGSYTDGRHPDEVVFTSNLVEDLKRRDFTINAMAYNPKIGIVDEFDGISDLRNKIIKCVGNPKERFTEDALRMLRAVRFAAKLGFCIEENTANAIKDMAPNIKKVSKERIQSELNKLVMSDNPEVLMLIKELQLDKYIIEDSVLVDDTDSLYENIIKVMQNTSPDHYLRWAAFMMYESDRCRKVLKGLKFDNKTINICGKLVDNMEYFCDFENKIQNIMSQKDILDNVAAKKYIVRKLLVDMGTEVFWQYYMPFMKAVAESGCNVNDGLYVNVETLEEVESLFLEITEAGDCIAKNQMAVKGAELIAAGVETGKVMGEVIDKMFDEILRNPSMNDKDKLLTLIGSWK